MLNNITLCGRVTSDIELKTTQAGKSVASFTLAVERDFSSNGEKETDFIPIVVWGSTAEFASKYFGKGRMMIVIGRLQVRPWSDKEGNKRTTTEVVADKVHFAGDKSKSTEVTVIGGNEPMEEVLLGDDELPF